ncbi:hypothetical protein [Acetobacterium wieringae]|uniref:Uncharacterized protein n=1 Tax=Acetobacterium wieringae TaxID=52694 RepID=A0A1F2PLV1_9FIRM|nr:hypothetical protein [Acetobacterium wieringae]OFV71722.1 hypothetical protein ACWI_07720 [Acetobacterium wieringae]URN85224.1 hypothetical protein CHL1_000855 [Acetobacterium wieringae]
MDQKTETIISQLKNALERQEPGTNDHQWIMGISINDDRKQCVIVRVVLKTNGSPYVDGMDILFDKTSDQLTMDPNYYQNSPDFMGGTVTDSFKWLRNHGDLIYQQMDDPDDSDRGSLEASAVDELNHAENNSNESRCSK